MKISRLFSSLLMMLTLCGSAAAQDFFSTAMPEHVFNIGVRVGVNTSNRNISRDLYNYWNVNSWGTGFDAGAVVDINFRDYLTIQPGFFYETRSGKYAYSQVTMPDDENDPMTYLNQFGKLRTYNFTIPILASVRFNVSDKVRWSVDFGPYFNFKLGSSGQDHVLYPETIVNDSQLSKADYKTFDFGFKIGTGIQIFRHYYVGVHYMAGCLDVWKSRPEGKSLGGRNKGWVFTAGYDF